jgi:hypothetical protein
MGYTDVRTAVWLALACALGGFAASAALGQTVPIPLPTVSTPTVSVPSVTVPSVTVPPATPPAPAPPTPSVQTPPAQTPPVQVSGSGASVGGTGVSTGGSTGGGGSGGSGSAGGAGAASSGGSASSSSGSAAGGSFAAGSAAGPAGARGSTRLASTRSWIAAQGPAQRRVTTLRFRLRGNGLVRFTVMQVAPLCRFVMTFAVHGHAGLNRVRFGGRVHGAPLAAGTYRITARTRRGAVIAVTTLVVVDARAPSPDELALARQSNVCAASGVLGEAAVRGSLAAALDRNANGDAGASTIVRHQRESDGKPSKKGKSPSGDSSNSVASASIAAVDKAKSPLVIVLLGLAVTMLGLAALPRTAVADPRVSGLVVAHRVELAAAGTAALLAAVVAMMLA